MLRIKTFTVAVLMLAAAPAVAQLNIFACEPEWASLAQELGGEQVVTYSATTAYQDPHHIQARPSLIARLRRADLLICSGAELEIGWLPMLQRQAANPHVMPGQTGNFEAAAQVHRLEIHQHVDRTMGDVHAAGNPHVHLDPRRLLSIAHALSLRLETLDPAHAQSYRQRMKDFDMRWQQAMSRWQQQARGLQGMQVVVHHKDWSYLFDWLGIKVVGSLEPKPGLPPSAGHLARLKQQVESQAVQMIIHTAYQSPRAAQHLSQQTGVKVVELPYTVGGAKGVEDLFGLFDLTLKRLSVPTP